MPILRGAGAWACLAAGMTVTYATGGGTATEGVDYVPVSGTLTFAAGVAAKAFAVPIVAEPAGLQVAVECLGDEARSEATPKVLGSEEQRFDLVATQPHETCDHASIGADDVDL